MGALINRRYYDLELVKTRTTTNPTRNCSILLSPVAVYFFSTPDKLYLTRFKWLETIDNDLSGDDAWKNLRLWGTDPLSFINRTRWLWRNGGNYVNYMVFGVDGNAIWNSEQDRNKYYWRRPDGYWLYRRFVNLPLTTRKLELFFGWNLFSIKNGRCKLVCQVRIRTSA